MTDQIIPTPIAEAKTLNELNIHIGYIREKMNTINETNMKKFDELKEQIALQAHSFVNQDEFSAVKKITEENAIAIRVLIEFKDTLQGKMWGVGVIVAGIFAIISFLANKFL